MAFLVVVGGLQFVYCVLAGNYVGRFSVSVRLRLGWLGEETYIRGHIEEGMTFAKGEVQGFGHEIDV